MILVIDNYDSFTYNLVQYLGEMAGCTGIKVCRNDGITPGDVVRLAPQRIVLSPGPGNPDSAGNCLDIVRRLQGSIPLLGVCLGHQVIGQAYGGQIVPARNLMHGKVSTITHNGRGLFRGIRNHFKAARYHSLVVNPENLPPVMSVIAASEDGEIMALKHRLYPAWGIQFHPESILTEHGKSILMNFLQEEELNDEGDRSDSCRHRASQPQ